MKNQGDYSPWFFVWIRANWGLWGDLAFPWGKVAFAKQMTDEGKMVGF